MKKLMICLLALTFTMSLVASAQQDTMAPPTRHSASAPLKTLKGTVKTEGGKVTFVRR